MIPLEQLYPAPLLEARRDAETHGNLRDKIRYDLIDRPHYAFGLLAAADMARFCGLARLTAIEFGVAEGGGLRNLCEVAALVTTETGIAFDIFGFDTGGGLPALQDWRDHPEIWTEGDFGCVDRTALEASLPANAKIIWGDIRDTLPAFKACLSEASPIGFIANDLDLYSSTFASFSLYDSSPSHMLPVVMHYFDDTHGSPVRIGSLFRNRWCGQLGAISEFNGQQEHRKFDSLYTLKVRRPMHHALWLEQMFALHVMDHPLRQIGAARPTLRMGEHVLYDRMAWPL